MADNRILANPATGICLLPALREAKAAAGCRNCLSKFLAPVRHSSLSDEFPTRNRLTRPLSARALSNRHDVPALSSIESKECRIDRVRLPSQTYAVVRNEARLPECEWSNSGISLKWRVANRRRQERIYLLSGQSSPRHQQRTRVLPVSDAGSVGNVVDTPGSIGNFSSVACLTPLSCLNELLRL